MPLTGWIPPTDRTPAMMRAHEAFVGECGEFFLAGQTSGTDGQRVVLWDASRKARDGNHLPTLAQERGSCVSQGCTNALMYLMCAEILNGDRERLEIPCLPVLYGFGRLCAGIRGRGDGSTGSGQAKAVRDYGVIENDAFSELPQPYMKRGAMTWGGDAEYQWSDGRRIADKWATEGRKHPVKTTALVRSYVQVRDAICNGYPVTVASDRGFTMQPKLDRKTGKMFGVPRGNWNHQMCFIGCDDDSRRPGCYCMNSWGPDAHGKPAGDEPPGGFWVDADVVDYMTRQGDSFAYSQFDGFPQQTLEIDWSMA